MSANWLGKKKASLCILAGICSISICVIVYSGEKLSVTAGGAYIVKLSHYGLDAAQIERTISIPLEDALAAIPGARTVQSSSENNHSRVFVRFANAPVFAARRAKGRYEAVRDAAQKVYESLPQSAQRPIIVSSDNSQIPVWSAAVLTDSGNITDISGALERTVKPKIESLEGAGEVIVSGTGLKEIVITLDQEKTAAMKLDPFQVAAALEMNDALFSGGKLAYGNREMIVTVDGRYSASGGMTELHALGRALIPLGEGGAIELSEIARINEQERVPDTLSRLNGKKAAVLAVMGSHDADLRRLSRDINREISALEGSFNFIVLSDIGAEETAAYRSVFNAAVQGTIMVAFIGLLLNGNTKVITGFFCALSVPTILLIAAAVLSASGLPINRLALAGIAAGIGTAIDPVILCAEKLGKCKSNVEGSFALVKLRNPLIAGAATSVVALLPLSAIDAGEVKIISASIAVVTMTALAVSLTLLPPLLLWACPNTKSPYSLTPLLLQTRTGRFLKRLHNRITRLTLRRLAFNFRFCAKHPVQILIAGTALSAAAIIAVILRGADTGSYGSEDSVYAQVEFESGLIAEEADRILASYGETLAARNEILNVQTGARSGSGSVLISFNPKITPARVKELARQIPIPGFLFFPENSAKDRYWEIRITGDENRRCAELAEELARLIAGHPLAREQVLNFKTGNRKISLVPDRQQLAVSKVGFGRTANMIRVGVFGPVVYKRINSQEETDVRITLDDISSLNNGGYQSREGLMNIIILQGGEDANPRRVNSLTEIREEAEPGTIRRIDRRRAASITIATGPMDPRRVKKALLEIFRKLPLPPGYSVEFDPDAINQADTMSGTIFSLFMAIFFCYMVIASINESLIIPVVALCAIPPSLAVPALCMAVTGTPFTISSACAFIAVSGMTVNAAVLCADSLRPVSRKGRAFNATSLYRAIRKIFPALLATTATTIAGAFPFLFLKEEANTLIKNLSLVGTMGVAGSFICSITLVPALSLVLRKTNEQKWLNTHVFSLERKIN